MGVSFPDEQPQDSNNYLEGWHNKLKRIARKAHPNVFEIFKQEQSEQRSQLTRTRELEN